MNEQFAMMPIDVDPLDDPMLDDPTLLDDPALPDGPTLQDDPVPASESPLVVVDEDGDGVGDAMVLVSDQGAVLGYGDPGMGISGLLIDTNADGLPDVLITEAEDSYQVSTIDESGQPQPPTAITREELTQLAPRVVALLDLPDPASLPLGPITEIDPDPTDQGSAPTDQGSAPTDQGITVNPHTPVDQDVPAGPDLPADPTIPAPEDPSDPFSPQGLGSDPYVTVQDGQIIGNPEALGEHWFAQASNGMCAPASVAQVVSAYTGLHFTSEAAFVDLANQLGLFTEDPDGVPSLSMDGVVTLLEATGIPAELEYGSMEELAEALAQGRGVIAFVDSGELWTGENVEDQDPDHAVVVIGIDLERHTVIVSDPGHPGGREAEIPLDLFDNAWADGDHAMAVCEQPATEIAAAHPAGEGDIGAVSPAVSTHLHNPNGWVLLPTLGDEAHPLSRSR